MEEAIKNLMMQRAMQGGAPTGGSMPMASGRQGAPMPSAGGGAMPVAAGGTPGGGMPTGGGAPQINPALLKAVMAARAGSGKGAPKGKVAPKGKPSAKGKAAPKGKAPAKGGKGRPVPKKAAR